MELMCTQEAQTRSGRKSKKKNQVKVRKENENHLIAWSLIDHKFYLRKALWLLVE